MSSETSPIEDPQKPEQPYIQIDFVSFLKLNKDLQPDLILPLSTIPKLEPSSPLPQSSSPLPFESNPKLIIESDQVVPFTSPLVPEKAQGTVPDEMNNLNALIESGTLSEREERIIRKIAGISPLLYRLLKSTYPENGWRVCGPASIALSRMLSYEFDIPIGQKLEGEHIEVCVGVYDPVSKVLKDGFASKDDMRIAMTEEHTYLKYFSSDSRVYYIDPIYQLLMEGKNEESTLIMVEQYPVEYFDAELARRQNIFQFQTYPGSNFYHCQMPVWRKHFLGYELGSELEQTSGAVRIHIEHIQTQKIMNEVVYDGIPVVFITDRNFVRNHDYILHQKLAEEPGYENMREVLIQRLQQMDPTTNDKRMEAYEKYVYLKRHRLI